MNADLAWMYHGRRVDLPPWRCPFSPSLCWSYLWPWWLWCFDARGVSSWPLAMPCVPVNCILCTSTFTFDFDFYIFLPVYIFIDNVKKNSIAVVLRNPKGFPLGFASLAMLKDQRDWWIECTYTKIIDIQFTLVKPSANVSFLSHSPSVDGVPIHTLFSYAGEWFR